MIEISLLAHRCHGPYIGHVKTTQTREQYNFATLSSHFPSESCRFTLYVYALPDEK